MKLLIASSLIISITSSVSVLARTGASAYHDPEGQLYHYECEGDFTISINYTINKSNIAYKGDVLSRCENRDTTIQGEMLDYGEGKAVIKCRGGEVFLANDYDELVFRPSPKMQRTYKSMKDYEYFCEEI